jgi:topoisomerase IV subunit A
MVLMAQPFSMRYPLIEGTGELGVAGRSEVVRGDALHRGEADAVRGVLLSELELGTVRLGAELRRHDARAALLPSRLPHVLLNGASGIAVGMATDIPSHNLREIVECLRSNCSTTPTRRSRS